MPYICSHPSTFRYNQETRMSGLTFQEPPVCLSCSLLDGFGSSRWPDDLLSRSPSLIRSLRLASAPGYSSINTYSWGGEETDCVYLLPASFCTYGLVLITWIIHKPACVQLLQYTSPVCSWQTKVQHLSSLLPLIYLLIRVLGTKAGIYLSSWSLPTLI